MAVEDSANAELVAARVALVCGFPLEGLHRLASVGLDGATGTAEVCAGFTRS